MISIEETNMGYEAIYERIKDELEIHNEYYHYYYDHKKELNKESDFSCGFAEYRGSFEEGWCMALGFVIDLIHEE